MNSNEIEIHALTQPIDDKFDDPVCKISLPTFICDFNSLTEALKNVLSQQIGMS